MISRSKIKAFIVTAVAIACVALPSVSGARSVVAWDNPICDSLTDPIDRELAGCDETQTIFDKGQGVVVTVFSVIGALAVGMIIFGGIRYMISQGDPGKLKKAKDTIMYAVIGLVVTLSAFAITMFILEAV